MRALQLEVRRSLCALPRRVCLPSACIFVCLRVFVLTSYSNVLLDLAPSASRSSRYLLNPHKFRGLLSHPPSPLPPYHRRADQSCVSLRLQDRQKLVLIFFSEGRGRCKGSRARCNFESTRAKHNQIMHSNSLGSGTAALSRTVRRVQGWQSENIRTIHFLSRLHLGSQGSWSLSRLCKGEGRGDNLDQSNAVPFHTTF